MLEERELGVAEHEAVVALGDEHDAAEVERGGGEGTTVDDPGQRRQRVDAETGPGQLGERQAGHHPQVDPAGGRRVVQQRHRAFGDARAAGHRIGDLTVLVGRGEQRRHDVAVHVVEVGRGVVAVVEGADLDAGRDEVGDSRVPGGTHEPGRDRFQRGACRRDEEVGAARAETHDDDPTRRPHQPDGDGATAPVVDTAGATTRPLRRSQVP